MNRIRSSLLATMLGVAVLLVGANPAAAEASMELRDTLIMNADGSLTALVSYSCTPDPDYTYVFVTISVQQTKANATTSGSGYAEGYRSGFSRYGTMVCDGNPQVAAITVREQSGPGFSTGKAFADVAFRYCNPDGCTTSTPDQFVRITK